MFTLKKSFFFFSFYILKLPLLHSQLLVIVWFCLVRVFNVVFTLFVYWCSLSLWFLYSFSFIHAFINVLNSCCCYCYCMVVFIFYFFCVCDLFCFPFFFHLFFSLALLYVNVVYIVCGVKPIIFVVYFVVFINKNMLCLHSFFHQPLHVPLSRSISWYEYYDLL